MINFDPNVLLGYYQSRYGGAGSGTATSTTTAKAKYAPTPPWDSKAVAPRAEALVKSALAGRKFIDEGAAQLDLPGASADYRKLFALYQGLNALQGLAERMDAKGVSTLEKDRVAATFAKGLTETGTYIDQLKLDQLRVTRGEVSSLVKSAVGVPRTKAEYVTAPIHTGSSTDVVTALEGDIQFNIEIKRLNTTFNVSIDLNQMGAQPRSLANVINFVNGKLADEGVATRFATQRIPGAPKTTVVGGKTITIGTNPDQWALKIKGDTTETVKFSATATAPAVYLAQGAGNPNPDGKADTDDDATVRQLLKIQTATGSTPGAVPQEGATYRMDGQVFARTLGPEVEAVRATQVGPDGSVYLLAEVSNKIDGQTIKGAQDVALLKYDSAGNLMYARTLGAAETAGGMALSVAADGRVAIAGSVSGALIEGSEGLKPGVKDSFVTVFDAEGEEVWTQRRAALAEDEASAVAFGADGVVYVAGRAKSSMPGASAAGGWDGYLQAFGTQADGTAKPLFTQQFGTALDDKVGAIAVSANQVVVAGVENGHGVLRSFDVAPTTATVGAVTYTTAAVATAGTVRDLGALTGGDITGVAFDGAQVVVAGSTRNTALAAGTVTRAHAGGMDAFAARLSADLTAAGTDRIAYFGGTGDDLASGLAVSGGQVWLTGAAGTDLPGLAKVGDKDGFIARLDVAAGAIDWSRRFTGTGNQAAPAAIAVDASGASALDRLGLPQGWLAWSDSTDVTAVSAARDGDQFQVRTREGGRAGTVTIETGDTLETLAAKIRRAGGFQVKVDIIVDGDVRRLQVKPLNDRSSVELLAGKGGRDALEALGLDEGVARATRVIDGKTISGDGGGTVYGLKLARDLDITSKAGIKTAMDELTAALSVIRTAYRDLESAAKPKSAQSQASGPVPAYLTNQIANYQAALDRLGG